MICPNCGAQLPDTAKMCFCCKTTIQAVQQAENKEIEKKEKLSGKGTKKLYVLLVAAIIAMAGLFYAYMVINGKWRLPFQKKTITYVNYTIFDYSYAVSDEWEGDGRLDADDRTYFRFKHGQYMISRTTISGPINEESRDAFIEGAEKNGENSFSKENIFYLNGRKAFFTSGILKIDNEKYKTRMLVTSYDGYMYVFTFGMEEKYFDEDLANDVLSHVNLPGFESYTLNQVGYAVPSEWKEDKQYEKGLRFKGDGYEFFAEKKKAENDILDENVQKKLVNYYMDTYGGGFYIKDAGYRDGYPALIISGIGSAKSGTCIVNIFIYQIDDYQYIFFINDSGTRSGSVKQTNAILDSIHIEK